MKYVITGGAGHISAIVAEQLLAAGKDVTVIGRNPENLKTLVAKGAKTAIGSLEDEAFVKQTFADADVVYTMVPPNFQTDDYTEYQQRVGRIFYNAIKASSIKHVVNLSSIGAHLPGKVGVVNGMIDNEELFKTLTIPVINLRPGSFFYNLFSQIPTIKSFGIMGSNYTGNALQILVDPADIADVAVKELLALQFTGNTNRYIASEEITGDELAKVVGAAIGKPDLKWVFVPSDQLKAGMLQSGLKETMANGFVQMGEALNTGEFVADYLLHKPVLGIHKLGAFVKTLAAAYNAPGQPAAH